MGQNRVILDVGSSKILCLICAKESGSLRVAGAGVVEYEGFRHGELPESRLLRQAVAEAVGMAESEVRQRVRSLSVGVPAPFLRMELTHGETELTKRGRAVTEADMEQLMNASLEFELPDDYHLIHSTPLNFEVREEKVEGAPVDVMRRCATAEISHVMMREDFREAMIDAMDKLGIDVDMFIGVPLAESLFVIPGAERKNGAVLIDVGAFHTEVSLVMETALQALEVIEIGGWHFANDLAYGLNIPFAAAENLKRRYGFSPHCQDSCDVVKYPDGSAIKVEHSAVAYIMEARSEELIRHVCGAMMDMGLQQDSGLPLYLTGGGVAQMRGYAEHMERCMGIPVQLRMPWMPRLSSPGCASGFAVMDFIMNEMQEAEHAGRENLTAIKDKIKNFFRK